MINGAAMPTAVTGFQVTAEGGRTTLGQGAEHPLLGGRCAVPGEIAIAVDAQDVTQIGSAPRSSQRGRSDERIHAVSAGGGRRRSRRRVVE